MLSKTIQNPMKYCVWMHHFLNLKWDRLLGLKKHAPSTKFHHNRIIEKEILQHLNHVPLFYLKFTSEISTHLLPFGNGDGKLSWSWNIQKFDFQMVLHWFDCLRHLWQSHCVSRGTGTWRVRAWHQLQYVRMETTASETQQPLRWQRTVLTKMKLKQFSSRAKKSKLFLFWIKRTGTGCVFDSK